MRAMYILLLLLVSCAKEDIEVCAPVTEITNQGNVIKWNGAGPFVVERVDRLNLPVSMDTVSTNQVQYTPQDLGWVRVKPVCGEWSKWVSLGV